MLRAPISPRSVAKALISIASLLLAAAGCVTSSAVPCGDVLCPGTSLCVAATCVTPEEVSACEGIAESAACATVDRPNGLFCVAGACVGACGDGKRQGPEVCDDGNQVPGDGCTADCRSTEVCGDGVLDPLKLEQCDAGLAGLSNDGCSSVCTFEFDSWLDISPSGFRGVHDAAMAYDPERKVVVAFGGAIGTTARNETWEWDGVFWVRRHPVVSPPARYSAAMAYDQVHHRMVLFGGRTNEKNAIGDTWRYDGVTWAKATFSMVPAERFGHAMAVDPSDRSLMMFGGEGLTDTWRYDGVWTKVGSDAPSPRLFHSMATTSNGILLNGGTPGGDSVGALDDTWRWTGMAWQKVVGATQAGQRVGASMAEHGPSRRVFMFGGSVGLTRTVSNELWEFVDEKWSLVSTTPLAVARTGTAMAYDAARLQLVLFGGELATQTTTSETDTFDGVSWTNRTPPPMPSPRQSASAAYDPLQGRMVVFGGANGSTRLNETWTFDGSTWTQQFPATRPTKRALAAMAYDVDRKRAMLFGGRDIIDNNETWAWDGSQWTLVTTSGPAPRRAAAMAYDARRHRLVLFGGQVSVLRSNETWEFDGTTWIDRTPASTSGNYPTGRARHSMAYDAARGVTVMVGGERTATEPLDETWEWDGTSWQRRDVGSTPGPSSDASMVYDSQSQTVLLFTHGLMWSYNGTAWRKRSTIVAPEERAMAVAVYDAVRHQAVLFGGFTSSGAVANDTWRFATQAPLDVPDTCVAKTSDTDNDELAGCDDPDCWGRCTPLCPPGQPCAADAPRCGDGECNAAVEDWLLCDVDCPAPP